MKSFSVNFKLQSVQSKTKPIQLVLNLNTRDEQGRYLNVAKSIGQSVLPKEWDSKRGLPNDFTLATQLIKLKEDVLFRMKEHESLNDEDLIFIAKTDYFKTLLSETIDRVFYGKFSDNAKLIADADDKLLTTSLAERNKIKNKIIDLGYRLINSEGNLIDLDRFFSNLAYFPEEEKLNKVLTLKPSAIQNSNQSEDLYPIPFHEYINQVAQQKFINETLKKAGVDDYKNKLAKRFELWDKEVTLGMMTDNIAAEFFMWIRDNFEFSANYYANFKKWVKAVLNYAIIEEKKVLPFVNTESSTYTQNKEKVIFPYLTEEMLAVLLKLEFDEKEKHLEYVRDLFYIASNTGGLTFGDLSQAFNIQKRDVDGHNVNYIRIARNKTGMNAEIPLMDGVHEILKKYNFTFKPITNQHYNNNIQEVCLRAGFTDDFIQVRKNIRTKKQEPVSTPLYELIGSHTARRSFCTNMYFHRGLDPSLIMPFSQHSKLESFLTYVQASAKIKFDEFSKRVVISERENNQD